jgi:DNA-directed RNA polymerase beta subunit
MSSFELEPEQQHVPGEEGEGGEKKTYKISFKQIYLSKPMVTEADGMTSTLFPKEARLRNLTYSAPLYVDMEKTVTTVTLDSQKTEEVEKINKVFIGKVPIMLRSEYCSLHDHTDKELTELGECPYDEGGYFIINGSEKVLIAQEKMSSNHVYVFKKRQPSKYMWVAECRSSPESGARAASACVARMLHSPGTKMEPGCIRVTLPYIRTDIPLFVVFRALGFVADKDILEHIVYDFNDHDAMELWKTRFRCWGFARKTHQVRSGNFTKGTSATRWGRRGVRNKEGILSWVHRAQTAAVRTGKTQRRRPGSFRQQAHGFGRSPDRHTIQTAVPEVNQGCAALLSALCRQRKGNSTDIGSQGEDYHIRTKILTCNGQLGCARSARHQSWRVSGLEPIVIFIDVESPSTA